MKAVFGSVLAVGITLAAVSAAHAGNKVTEAADACKAEVASMYAVDGEAPRVKFDGTRGVGKSMKMRIRVYPEGASPFNALCQVDRNSGNVVAVTTASDGAPTVANTN